MVKARPTYNKGEVHIMSKDVEQYDYEPSILDANMFTVYEGDLIKEISSSKVYVVDQIGKDGIVARIGDMQSWMSCSKFLWIQDGLF